MGGVAMIADKIVEENVYPTISMYLKDVLNKIQYNNWMLVGSAGKKNISGDIDLAFDTDLSIQEVSSILETLGIEHKVGLGFKQIWTKFDQYNARLDKIDKTVQIDLIFGNVKWLSFAYHSPISLATKYTAHHAKVLTAAIIRYAKNEQLPDGGIRTYVINWDSGIYHKSRYSYISKRGKNKGQIKEKQIKSKYPICTSPECVAKLLTEELKVTWTVDDLKNTFEYIWKKTCKSFDDETLIKIVDYVTTALNKRNGYDVPKELIKFSTSKT